MLALDRIKYFKGTLNDIANFSNNNFFFKNVHTREKRDHRKLLI